MTEYNQKRQAIGRVEFLACKEDILDLLRKGHSIRNTHKIMIENGKISMSYHTLRKYITNPIQKKKSKPKEVEVELEIPMEIKPKTEQLKTENKGGHQIKIIKEEKPKFGDKKDAFDMDEHF